jgi:SOUL heme-binding protein
MQPFVDDLPANVAGPEPTVFDPRSDLRSDLRSDPRSGRVGAPHATQARSSVRWRRAALWASLATVPAAASFVVSRLTSRRTGVLAGGLTALAIGALRVELARWFTPEPAFHAEGELGDLEIRHYPARIEARAVVANPGLEAALDHGYSRLACFVYGANAAGEVLARTTPVLTAMHNGMYEVSFVMPPGRTLETLPQPNHTGVELREVPAHRVAVLPFRGRFTRDNIASHERALLGRLVDTGLAARGSVSFAAFDSPATLSVLRRNELWIEIL